MNHQGLLWNVHCTATVVRRKQLNFKSAVIRPLRSSCRQVFLCIKTFFNSYVFYCELKLSFYSKLCINTQFREKESFQHTIYFNIFLATKGIRVFTG